MQLNSLFISHLRNLRAVDLQLNPQFNIFCGENGSGKTSLLEAVHLLTTGRSFRASKSRQIIAFGEKACQVAGVAASRDPESAISPVRLGVERLLTGAIKIRLAEQDCQSIAELAKTLPLQLINCDSYDILEANPQYRRQFIDWAMFHVEHSFFPAWQRFKRALQQRNAALKEGKHLPSAVIQVWDKDLVECGELIDAQRIAILQELTVIFTEIIGELLEFKQSLSIQYQSGWNKELSFQEALNLSFERDRAWGYTTLGPQRGDLEFLIGGVPAKHLLSRGQLKLFICGLIMARATLLYRRTGQHCVFLIDDLNSELDFEASRRLIVALRKLGSQVLITSIEVGDPLIDLLEDEPFSMFQVKDGEITPLNRV